MPQKNLHEEFFQALSVNDIAGVTSFLGQHPEAVTWLYARNGLNDPVTIAAHDLDMLKLLLDHKADPNAANRVGDTRLIQLGDNAAFAELLLNYGADIDKPNNDGLTPLMRTGYNHSTDVVRLLLERGADPDLKRKDGKTAADIAEERLYPSVAALINEYSARKRQETLTREIGGFNEGLERDIIGLRPLALKKRTGARFEPM